MREKIFYGLERARVETAQGPGGDPPESDASLSFSLPLEMK